jgi:hypothetical protein
MADQTPLRPHERAGLQTAGVQPAVLCDVARCLGAVNPDRTLADLCLSCARLEPSTSDRQPWIAITAKLVDGQWFCMNRRFHDRNGAPDGKAGESLTVAPLEVGAMWATVQTRGVSL